MPPVAFVAAYATSNTLAALGATVATQALVSSAVASAVPTLLVLGGAALVLAATRPKAPGTPPSSLQQNLLQAVPSRIRYYGQNLTGGSWALYTTRHVSIGTGSGVGTVSEFNGVLILGHGESTEILDSFINSRRVVGKITDGAGINVVTLVDYKDHAAYNNDPYPFVIYKDKLGTDDQTSETWFNSKWGDSWTTNHRLRGATITYVQYTNQAFPDDNSRTFPGSGLPVYTNERKCSKIYDPRTGSTAYSENLALVLADFFAHADGWGLGSNAIDWDNIAEEADVAGSILASKGEGSIMRYACAGGYDLNVSRIDTLTEMLIAGDAIIVPRANGKIGIKVGRWQTPTVTIETKNILRMQAQRFPSGPDDINTITPKYTDRRLGYKETVSTGVEDSAAVAEAGANIVDAPSMLWVPKHNQACRIAKRILRVARADWKVSFRTDLAGLQLMGERFFYLDYPRLGISGPFELQSFTLEQGGGSCEVSAISVGSSDWNFDPVTEEPDLPVVPADPDSG